MITFKQYLEESRSAPLYHGVGSHSVGEIFDSGAILPKTKHYAKSLLMQPNDEILRVAGVSLTRNKNFAKHWSIDGGMYGVVFEFDQVKISQRFRLIPINFWYRKSDKTSPARKQGNSEYNEYEEFAINAKLEINKYVTSIWFANTTSATKTEKEYSDTYKRIIEHPKYKGIMK